MDYWWAKGYVGPPLKLLQINMIQTPGLTLLDDLFDFVRVR